MDNCIELCYMYRIAYFNPQEFYDVYEANWWCTQRSCPSFLTEYGKTEFPVSKMLSALEWFL